MTAPLPQRVVEPAPRREAEVICEGRPVLVLDADREPVISALADLLVALVLADEARESAS